MDEFWIGFIVGIPVWGSLGVLIMALVIGGNRDD